MATTQQLTYADYMAQPLQQPWQQQPATPPVAQVPAPPPAVQVPAPPPAVQVPAAQPQATTQTSPFTNQTPIAPANQTSVQGSQTAGVYNPVGDEAQIGLDYLGQVLRTDNALMRNAQQQGIEAAAARGLTNSSIAAGASQRAALDYAMPLVQQSYNLFGDRENRQWQTGERLDSQNWQSGENLLNRNWQTGERVAAQNWQSNENLLDRDWRSLEADLDRNFTTQEREAVQAWQSGEQQLSRDQQVLMANIQEEMNRSQRDWTAQQNQLDRDQQLTMGQVQNWLNNESFMRDFNAQLATMPINSAAQLSQYIAQQAINNPEVYTPEIVSGMTEFFTTNTLDVLSRYFPNYFRNTGGQ